MPDFIRKPLLRDENLSLSFVALVKSLYCICWARSGTLWLSTPLPEREEQPQTPQIRGSKILERSGLLCIFAERCVAGS
jgi:hypothetical protein